MTKTAYFIGGEWDGVKRTCTPLDRIEVAKMEHAYERVAPYSRYDNSNDVVYSRDVYKLATVLSGDIHVYQLEKSYD